ncbi:hypothetical protein Tco_0001692 [Tanacetum coccineum]
MFACFKALVGLCAQASIGARVFTYGLFQGFFSSHDFEYFTCPLFVGVSGGEDDGGPEETESRSFWLVRFAHEVPARSILAKLRGMSSASLPCTSAEEKPKEAHLCLASFFAKEYWGGRSVCTMLLFQDEVLTSIVDRPIKCFSWTLPQKLHYGVIACIALSSNGKGPSLEHSRLELVVLIQCLESSNASHRKDEWSILLKRDGSLVGIF